MTDVTKRISAFSLFLWIMVATVMAFNITAAFARDERLTYAALGLTGLAALVGIVGGIVIVGRGLAKQLR